MSAPLAFDKSTQSRATGVAPATPSRSAGKAAAATVPSSAMMKVEPAATAKVVQGRGDPSPRSW